MSHEKILIVEDDAIVALNLERGLISFHYTVIGLVSSGESAIEFIKIMQPDLILMDIRLNGVIDGVAAASKIQDLIDIPIVYLTGLSDEVTLNRAKNTLPFGFLIKPVKDSELHATITIALLRHTRERKLKENERHYRELFLNTVCINQSAGGSDSSGCGSDEQKKQREIECNLNQRYG